MNITIAVNDFQHESWGKDFFPDDLPEEWRFDYYSNEFESILLDKSAQQKLGKALIAEMLVEADAGFMFVFEGDEQNFDTLETACSILFASFSGSPVPNKNDLVMPGVVLRQAELVNRQDVGGTACVLRVNSAREIKNEEIKQLLMHVYSRYSDFDQVYLFFGGTFQSIEVINTARIVNGFL